jgi:hypothetical protein
MNYSVKLRCETGKAGHRSVTYSTFTVDAKDEQDAARIATFKSKQRYFGGQPVVHLVSVTASAPIAEAPAPRGKIEIVDGKLRRTGARANG